MVDPWGRPRDKAQYLEGFAHGPTAAALGTSGDRNRQLFTGHEYDQDSGLYYAKARYLDPESGRFISRDSYLGESSSPAALHRYNYAHSNPGRFTDPTGHCSRADGLTDCSVDQVMSVGFESAIESGEVAQVGRAEGQRINQQRFNPSTATLQHDMAFAGAPSNPLNDELRPKLIMEADTGKRYITVEEFRENERMLSMRILRDDLITLRERLVFEGIDAQYQGGAIPLQFGGTGGGYNFAAHRAAVAEAEEATAQYRAENAAPAETNSNYAKRRAAGQGMFIGLVTTVQLATAVSSSGAGTALRSAARRGRIGATRRLRGTIGGVAPGIESVELNLVEGAAVPRIGGGARAGIPKGTSFEGTLHRAVNPKYVDRAWDLHPGNLAASHRYTDVGRGGLYSGTSKEAVLGELAHYNIDPSKVAWVEKSVKFDNVLDLTNPTVRRQLGVSLVDLTEDGYFMTHSLGDFARTRYSGILFPAARNKGTSHLVIFGEFK